MDISKIRDVRIMRKYSLEDLSAKTGIDKGMLSRIERGKINPTVKTMEKIIKALEVKWEMFL